MTEQYSTLAVEGAVSSVEVIPNPPVGLKNDGDLLGYLFNDILLPAGTAVAKAKVEQTIALGKAKAQAQVNAYHLTDPSIGPNDPKAALAAESQTLAQRWLPSWMLAQGAVIKTGDGKTVETKRVSLVGWAIIAGIAIGFLWILIRLFRR